MTENHTVTFREKREWKMLLGVGSFLMAVGAAALMIQILISHIMMWPTTRLGLLEGLLLVVGLVLSAAVVLVMLVGVIFFGGCGLALLKDFFLLKAAVKVTPDGVWGETNIFRDGMIPWECIGSVKLEVRDNKPAIAIQPPTWPPYPLWRQCSAATRRYLWQRHNRRQTPFYLYIHTADAPPEVILQVIETELAHFRSTAAE